MKWGKGILGAAVLALCAAALSAPLAAAASPANDDFADAQSLGVGGLPVMAAGTNVEATRELGEPVHAFEEPAGHSVWFSWEATGTEWVTFGTCGSGFGSLVDVYTDSSYASLERVPGSNEGPDEACFPAGSEATIHAVAGTAYAIRVDGNLSPQAPATKEGAVALQIRPTPPPANDAFAAAQTLTAESLEGGTFYRVDVSGFNWNATAEPGEPVHGAGAGGASVWYSWTAPASGDADVYAVGGAIAPLVGVYAGDSVAALTPVATTSLFAPGANLVVTAGTTYRFAVDSLVDGASGLTKEGHFTFLLYMDVPPPDVPVPTTYETAPPTLRPGGATPPETGIVRRRIRSGKRSATLSFRSSEAGGSFLCKLDVRKEAKCGSPSTYVGLAAGPHTFQVRAVDSAGNADPIAAISHFTIARRNR